MRQRILTENPTVTQPLILKLINTVDHRLNIKCYIYCYTLCYAFADGNVLINSKNKSEIRLHATVGKKASLLLVLVFSGKRQYLAVTQVG